MLEILAAISGLLKAIPALARIGELIDKWCQQWKDADVQKRKEAKDAAVDSAIANVLHPPTPEQQPTPDATGGLPSSGESRTGVVPGRPEDHQQPGNADRG